MYEDLIGQVEEAVALSRNWAHKGWEMNFGDRALNANSLSEAKALPRSFVFREEAINYWNQVELSSKDATEAGTQALEALKSDDLRSALDSVYLSLYIERPYAFGSKTWKSVYESVQNEAKSP
ncbi:MAG: hypothetical protein QF560_01695 [SAR324 cluster bacterium]|nr:hypothetical protein [SAR324 cluster bacterium]MDP7137069.1 hypothetical protein [SAR324 cluster bacterium]MDP7332866.1 hypothetical protein [SAR324 cluster bacterium]MDP7498057.1 hypothetical protein [SAR324 cluster bacterium]MEE1577863.1 hypothetical protein [Deltaproteobacteria bacterium]